MKKGVGEVQSFLSLAFPPCEALLLSIYTEKGQGFGIERERGVKQESNVSDKLNTVREDEMRQIAINNCCDSYVCLYIRS